MTDEVSGEVEPKFKVDIWYGHVEIDASFEPTGDGGMRGIGRSRWYDLDGNLKKTTPWSPTGAVIRFD